MKYTLDHLILVSFGVLMLGVWSMFIAILMKTQTYNEMVALVLLMLVGGWIGFSLGLAISLESTEEEEDETDEGTDNDR